MNLNSRIILSVRQFFKKYKKVILIVAVVWVGIFLINLYLKNMPQKVELSKSYTPDTPVMDEGDVVPTRLVNSVKSTIDEYFNYCNNKEYDKAYNMLTDDSKEYLYSNDISGFKEYIDEIFTTKKIYNIQNYSNLNDVYIYNFNILDDITATGSTDDYSVYQEKLAVHNTKDGLKISNKNYIGKEEIGKETESDYLKVKVLEKNMTYRREEYSIEIRNKTDTYIVISDDISSEQVTLTLGNQRRNALNTANANIVLLPRETASVSVLFDKYYDESVKATEINFNDVRMFPQLTNEIINEGDRTGLIRAISMNIPL